MFITHDFTEALKVGDRIAIMRDGKLVQIGTPEELVMNPADDYMRRFSVEAPSAKVVRASTIARSVPQASSDMGLDEAAALMRAADSGALLVTPTNGSPFVVTGDDLLAGSSARSLGDLANNTRILNEHALLAEVMKVLAETKSPAIIETASGEYVGIVDDAGVVEALAAAL